MQLLAQRVEDGAHQQRTEKSLCHGAHGVDKVALRGENDVLTA